MLPSHTGGPGWSLNNGGCSIGGRIPLNADARQKNNNRRGKVEKKNEVGSTFAGSARLPSSDSPQHNRLLTICCISNGSVSCATHWISFHQFSTSNKPNKRYNHKNTIQKKSIKVTGSSSPKTKHNKQYEKRGRKREKRKYKKVSKKVKKRKKK